jgi:hypothetical protein
MSDPIDNPFRPKIKLSNSERLAKVSIDLNWSKTDIANFLIEIGIQSLEKAAPEVKAEISKEVKKLFKLK